MCVEEGKIPLSIYGTSHTQVKLRAGDMKLRDGYTAYLVAKMLGVKLSTDFCYK